MSDLVEKGIQTINGYVTQWTSKYLFQTSHFHYDETDQKHTFMTEFSLPTPEKPVPIATVKVFFYIPDLSDPNERKIQFRFENDSLIHQFERTIRISQMEKWLEQILQRKERTSKILFLGTQFEETRINDTRMVELFKEIPKQIPIEHKFLVPELLEGTYELYDQQVFNEHEKEKEIKILRETLYQIFRLVDKDDLGMLSHEECMEVFKQMGLNLSKIQKEDLLHQLDVTKTGIINYEELVPQGAEIIHTIFSKNQAMRDLELKEEESRFQANLMLMVDQVHNVNAIIVEECKKFDEDETQKIDYETFTKVLEQKPEFLSAVEIQVVITELRKEHPDMVPYHQISAVYQDTIYQTLLVGLDSQNKTKLENYLISILEPYDTQKTGLIHINDIIAALKVSDKVMLSKVQLYVVQSFLDQDEQGQVLYNKQCKTLAQIIKKFFNLDLLSQKDQLLQNSTIDANTHINLLSLEKIQFDLHTFGK